MNVLSENCRFCLKVLNFCDKFFEVNDEIKRDFMDVTQLELMITDCYVNVICELCLRSLQLASSLKKQLIENQEKFYKDYEYATKFVQEYKEPAKRGRKKKIKPIEDETVMELTSEIIKQENPLDSIVIENAPILDDSQKFVCKICNKPFKSKLRLRKHKITHSTDKKIVCTACGKKFKRSENLKAHMVHHNDPKFQCDLCGRFYYEKSTIFHHLKSNHLNSRDYHCQYCSKSYFKLSDMNRHILSMHENRKFSCAIESCGKSFNYKHHCKIHITRMHRDVKFENIEDLIKYKTTKLYEAQLDVDAQKS